METDELRLGMSRRSPQKMSLWICLERHLGARSLTASLEGPDLAKDTLSAVASGDLSYCWSFIWDTRWCVCMASLSRGKTQSAPGNSRWASGMSSQVHGIQRLSIGIVRNPKPCARRGRPQCEGHDGGHYFLILMGQVRLGGGKTGWILCCFSLSQGSLKQWEGVCGGKGRTRPSRAEEGWPQGS